MAPLMRGTIALTLAVLAQAAPAEAPTFFPRGGDYPFSESVQAGDVLYLSGIIATGPDGKVVPGGIEAESRRVMELLGEALARRKRGYEDLIVCTVMLKDMAEWPAFNAVYQSYFKSGRYPARAAFGSTGLALGARIELQCNAWNPQPQM